MTNGTGTFSATLKTAGNQTITATDTVDQLHHRHQRHHRRQRRRRHAASRSAPRLATAGTAFNFTVTAQDAFGNTATGYSGTVHFTSSDARRATLPRTTP